MFNARPKILGGGARLFKNCQRTCKKSARTLFCQKQTFFSVLRKTPFTIPSLCSSRGFSVIIKTTYTQDITCIIILVLYY